MRCFGSFLLFAGISSSLGCLPQLLGHFSPLRSFARRLGKSAQDTPAKAEIPMINVPGQRFTATHGIKAKKGEQKLFLFLIEDGAKANYAAISANVALAGIEGGHDRYDLYLRYGLPPTVEQHDYRSVVTASDSYVGQRLYSHDIRIERPRPGPYYLLIQARKSFRELLVTAIVDTPPEEEDVLVRRGPGFVIQRMGEPQN